MYTIQIRFKGSTSAKTYHYASINDLSDRVGRYVTVCTPDGHEDVHLVACKQGISLNATKWQSGGLVTPEQRKRYGISPSNYKKELLECDIVRELSSACNTLQKYSDVLRETGAARGIGIGRNGDVYVSPTPITPKDIKEKPSRQPEPEWLVRVSELIKDGGKERKRQELVQKLQDIKAQAQKVADEIANL